MPNSNDQNNGFTSRFYMTTPVEGGEPIVQRYDIEALRLVDSESRNPINVGDSTHPVYFADGEARQCSGSSGGGGGSDVAILPKYKGGTLIANFSIDGQNGRIYSPSVAEVYKKATLWPPANSSGSYLSEVGDNNNSNPFKTMINNYEFLLIHYAPTNALSEERTMMLDAQVLKDSLPNNAVFSCHYLSDVFIKCKFTSQDKIEVIESRGIPLDSEETPQMLKCAIKKIEGLQFGASGEDLDQGLTVKQVLWEGVASDVDDSFRFRTGTVESFNYIYLHYYATNNQYEERILVLDQEAIINGLAQDPTAAYFTCDIADDLYIKGKFVSIDQFLITEVHSKTIDETVVKPVLSQIDGVCLGSVGTITGGGGDTSDCMKKGIDYVTAGFISSPEHSVLGEYATAEGIGSFAGGKASHAEGGWLVPFNPQEPESIAGNYATGASSHAEGYGSIAQGNGSHAEGGITRAEGDQSHAEGYVTFASGFSSHAEGGIKLGEIVPNDRGTEAKGDISHAEGYRTSAYSHYSHSEGYCSITGDEVYTAIGDAAHAEGKYTQARQEASHAEGFGALANGKGAHAEGGYSSVSGGTYGTYALNTNAHSEGCGTSACGESSHAEGTLTCAVGENAHSEGKSTYAIGNYSHSEGSGSTANGESSHTEGTNTYATGNAHAEGANTCAKGYASHAEGLYTYANGDFSHAEGGKNNDDAPTNATIAEGKFCHAEGRITTARGECSHTEGYSTWTIGANSHAEGYRTITGWDNPSTGRAAHAEGYCTWANDDYSHAEGYYTCVRGTASHAEGASTTTMGDYNHAEGYKTYTIGYVSSGTIYGQASHAEGYQTTTGGGTGAHTEGYKTYTVGGSGPHAEGQNTTACKTGSHAEGSQTCAGGDYAHSEGRNTRANGNQSHAEGSGTSASNAAAHAEGTDTLASNSNSHAQNWNTIASGVCSHAAGSCTTASNHSSTAIGHYNIAMTTGGSTSNQTGTAFVIGNGTNINSTIVKSNAFSVEFDGTVKAAGTQVHPSADYAEMFEWIDGNINNEDRVGYFVTFDENNKIRIANDQDDYILGIVSGSPCVLGNGDCDTWNGMYVKDNFNRIIYEDAPLYKLNEKTNKMELVLDENGNQVYQGKTPKINPNYDGSQPYISRENRKEWSAIGMLGVLAVRDDGTCQVNKYCKINAEGIATYQATYNKNENYYRVIERVADNIIKVVFK